MMSRFEEQHVIDDVKNKLETYNQNTGILGRTSVRGGVINSTTGVLHEDSNKLRVKADYKPEIYFIGQIVGGTDFPTELDGLFCEASLKFSENWKMFEKVPTL